MNTDMKKQTAVEWFAQWLNDNPVVYQKDYYTAIEWAKAMEKEQIVDAYIDIAHSDNNRRLLRMTAEDYYNETYGGDK